MAQFFIDKGIMVVCVLSSALILNFAYGLYQNFNTQKKEDNAELKEIVIDIGEDANLTRKEFQQYVESLSEETLNDMDIFIAGTLDCFQGCYYDTLDCRFAYRNGAYQVMESFRRNEEERMYSGRMITNEEENAGADVAVVDDADAKAGALVLSGHTHGGQMIPIMQFSRWFNIGVNDNIYGMEKRKDTDFIVTSGISDWAIKFKTGCRSEYVMIDINRK